MCAANRKGLSPAKTSVLNISLTLETNRTVAPNQLKADNVKLQHYTHGLKRQLLMALAMRYKLTNKQKGEDLKLWFKVYSWGLILGGALTSDKTWAQPHSFFSALLLRPRSLTK